MLRILGSILALGLFCLAGRPVPTLALSGAPQENGLALVAAQQGTATPISDPSGIRLLIVLNGVGDLTSHRSVPEPVGGRWITLDLSITNVGVTDFDLDASNFQVLSGNATIFEASTDSNLPQPQFQPTTLAAGQSMRGTVLFDIPTTQTLQSALFEAAGTTQFVIAPLGY